MHVATLKMPLLNGTKTQNTRQELIWKFCEAWASQADGRRRWFKGKIKQESTKLQNDIWDELKTKYGYAEKWDEEPTVEPVETWQGSVENEQEETQPITQNRIAGMLDQEDKKEDGGVTAEETNKSAEDQSNRRKRFVQWDEDETEFLALEIHRMRRGDPGAQVVHLLNTAQEQLEEGRRRNITTVSQFEFVLQKLKEIDEEVWADHEHMIQYREKIEEQKGAPTRTEVFADATEEEVAEFFKERVLDDVAPVEIVERLGVQAVLEMLPLPMVAGFTMQKQMECFGRLNDTEALMWDIYGQFESQKTGKNHQPISSQAQERNSNVVARKAKVVFYGLLPKQQQEVMSRMGDKVRFHFVDKSREREAVPSSADIIVFWARFCSHSLQSQIKRDIPEGCKFILHHSGIGEMVGKVNESLRQFC